jgi:hypothetical protein
MVFSQLHPEIPKCELCGSLNCPYIITELDSAKFYSHADYADAVKSNKKIDESYYHTIHLCEKCKEKY